MPKRSLSADLLACVSQADLLAWVPTDGDPSHDVADAASCSGPTNVNVYFVPCAKMVPPASGVASGSPSLRSDGRRPIAGRRRCSFRLETRNVTHKRERLLCPLR
ncbi:hypothetical protein quinque_012432 [Culex quinquefasciatus]